jgi:hypothetical protein
MITASVTNSNLIIYSSDITGFNTNYVFVFSNNVFKSISTYSFTASTINITLLNSVNPNEIVKLSVYPGGITTANSSLGTSFNASNLGVFLDPIAPSLYEIIQQNNYNSFNSVVYSNYIGGISTAGNFPSANFIIKRQPPTGALTLNEGFLGSMKIHRFAGLSSTVFTVGQSTSYVSNFSMAFNYQSYGDQLVDNIAIALNSMQDFNANSYAYLSINQDYYGYPSPVVVANSYVVNFTGISSNVIITVNFNFGVPITLSKGNYWFIIHPTSNSSISYTTPITWFSAPNNYYTSKVLQSSDGITFNPFINNGASFTIVTERGIVLPSVDTIFNQLNQPQSTAVTYGDSSNLSVYTSLAVPTTAHYIKKGFLDSSLIYAIETLVDSQGLCNYSVNGVLNGVTTSYYTMLASNLTSNIIRYNFSQGVNITELDLVSLGDYYAQTTQGTVLVSASDFLGISTIELSTSPNFPANSTTVINLNPSVQNYINNVSFNFGNLGQNYINLTSGTGNIQYIYIVNINNVQSYLIITSSSVYLYISGALTNIFSLTNSYFTSTTQSLTGILLTDSLGNIYIYSNQLVTQINSLGNIITSSCLQNSNVYIGISTIYDTLPSYNRKRIYSLSNNVLTHQSWSTQIPEPEITFLYPTSIGLIIGSYNQTTLVGKVYNYYNSILTQIFIISLRPDAAFLSSNTNNLYVCFSGSVIMMSTYNNKLSPFTNTFLNVVGNVVKEIKYTRISNNIILITDLYSYIFDEYSFNIIQLPLPYYSTTDQKGLLVSIQNNNLGVLNYNSSNVNYQYSNVYFDPILSGYSSNFTYNAVGYLIANNIPSTGYTTSFYLQYPSTTNPSILLNGQPVTLNNNSFTVTFQNNTPIPFSISLSGQNITGVGTIALYNGTFAGTVVGISSFIAQKNINWYVQTGSTLDIFGFSDGSLKQIDLSTFTSNQYTVYGRLTDINGNKSSINNLLSDSILTKTQQQNGSSLPSSRIIEINPFLNNNNVNYFVPPEGSSGYIYSGTKIVRATGIFESAPYYGADVTAWNQIQVLTLIPGYNQVTSPGSEWGTSVTLYVKTSDSAIDVQNAPYINSYTISTIDNGNDYQNQVVSILANISSLTGQWLMFKLVLQSASQNITPIVKSVLITYSGAGTSQFVTKTFNTTTQSTITPTPQFRRGILTANFVTNGGQITFGYTTDPTNGNPSTYTQITPNQVFTLPTPSNTIKFGVILMSANTSACFMDEFGVQMDLGPNNLYFMPPQSAFIPTPYYDQYSGNRIANAYQFINKSIGIVSSYNWSFGTSYPIGIVSFPYSSQGLAYTAQNPIIQFAGTSLQTVGLFITGWIENGVVFNSELYTYSFIST